MTDEYIIPVDAIYERDIDLLLLEEFWVNPGFRKWFLALNNLPKETKLLGAWKSISNFKLGETDILVSYQSQNENNYLLIENKLDAEFQDRQQLRYLERGEKYIMQGNCHNCFPILVAPKQYLENQSEFEVMASYEEIKNWLIEQNDDRLTFNSTILEIAIQKLRRGYQPINDPMAFDFWINYWRTLNSITAELKMNKPQVVPAGSDWPVLKNEELKGAGFKMVHKLSRGYIDAQTNEKLIQERLSKLKIPLGCSLAKTGKSLSVRAMTHVFDKQKPFDEQENQVKESIYKALELLGWIKENKEHWL